MFVNVTVHKTLLFFVVFQKIRTVELDGKTIKLQIVSAFAFCVMIVLSAAITSGTLPVKSDLGPSLPATTEGPTVSS